jgi:hypothetical protein
LANIPTTETVTAKRSTAARIGDTPFLTLQTTPGSPVQKGENRRSTVLINFTERTISEMLVDR